VIPLDARRRTLVTAIYDFIESQLADPAPSPGDVAVAHHISLRYLHSLFADQPVSVAGRIRRQRLERCRHDLLDPRLVTGP
jgi:AraC-like DNA-binding protein